MASEDDAVEDSNAESIHEEQLAEEGVETQEVGPESDSASVKKRRRKKKKKKKSLQPLEPQASTAQPLGGTKQELESRFAGALEQLQRDTTDSAWTRLDNCNIYDAKTRKVAAALRSSKQLTSLDLSSNHIGNAGAQALAAALKTGAAPELIFLDMRDNAFDTEASSQLEAVQKERRKLSIQLGAFVEAPELPLTGPRQSGRGSGKPNGRHRQVSSSGHWADPDGEEMLEVQNTLRGGERPSNGYLDRFFQVGNGGHADTAEPAGATVQDSETASQQIWEKLDTLLLSNEPSVHQLSSLLRDSLAGISREMATISVPLLSNTKLAELLPFTRQGVLKLALLEKALSIEPPSFVAPHSKSEPVAGVGSHRATVAQIVERLSYGRLGTINTHIVKAGLLPCLFTLSLSCPTNNILQVACGHTLRWALESGLHLLWQPLLQPAMGLARGVSPGSQPVQGSLATEVIAILEAAQRIPTRALRACNVGFALTVAQRLQEKAQTDELLSSSLQETAGWKVFAGQGGALEELLAEQQGDLCGPRPDRPSLASSCAPVAASEGAAAPDLISGTDLVKLLSQSVRGIHITENDDASDSDDSDDDQPAEEADPKPDALQRLIDAPVDSVSR